MTPEKTDYELFLEISALLTGFSKTELTGTGMLQSYYNTVLANNYSNDVQNFFAIVRLIFESPPETWNDKISASLIQENTSSANPPNLAKNIIILWYAGTWNNNFISSAAYIEGLMWNTAHAHAPGAKQPGFGSWAKLPVS
jgi:hypothetical protein